MVSHLGRFNAAFAAISLCGIGFSVQSTALAKVLTPGAATGVKAHDWPAGLNNSATRAATVAAMAAAADTEDDETLSRESILATRRNIAGDRALVPGLIRALSDRDDTVSRQAASLLALVGSHSADSAMPILVAKIAARQGKTDFLYRRSMASALTAIAGGPDRAAAFLTETLKRSRNAAERAHAAAAIGSWNSFEPADGDVGEYDPVQTAFTGTLGVLAVEVAGDHDPSVRAASLVALRQMMHFRSAALWKDAAPQLGAAVADTRLPSAERIAVMQFLCRIPAVSKPAASSVRLALNDPDNAVAQTASATLAYLTMPALAQGNSEASKWQNLLDSPNSQTRDQEVDNLAGQMSVNTDWGSPPPSSPPPAWLPILTPTLIKELHSQQDFAVNKAAGLLALIGPSAVTAAPDLTALAAQKYDPRTPDRALMLISDLTTVTGGPDAIEPYLERRLSNPSEAARHDAAVCIGLGAEHKLQGNFVPAIPALGQAAVKDTPDVRLAAITSLDAFTKDAPSTRMEPILGPIAARISDASLPLQERQAGARFIAHVPASNLDTLPQIRQALLSDDSIVRSYAILSLNHLLEIDSKSVVAAFVDGMSSRKAVDRRSAAQQMDVAATCFWRFDQAAIAQPVLSEYSQRPMWFHNDQNLSYPGDRFLKDAYRERVVIALGTAISDKDPATRVAAAGALEKIGIASEWRDRNIFLTGLRPKPQYDISNVYRSIRPSIGAAVTTKSPYGMAPIILRAQKAVESDDPALAKRLGELALSVDNEAARFSL